MGTSQRVLNGFIPQESPRSMRQLGGYGLDNFGRKILASLSRLFSNSVFPPVHFADVI